MEAIPRPARLLLAGLLTAAFLVTPELADPAAACATGHTEAHFTGFTEGPAPPNFYMSAENLSPASATIQVFLDNCNREEPVRINWRTDDATATAGSDYQDADGTSRNVNSPVCVDHCQESQSFGVPILQDGTTEPVVEYLNLSLSNPQGREGSPNPVPVYVVDDDGPTRVAFAPLATHQYSQIEFALNARIPVFRAGNASGSTTVDFDLAGIPPDQAEQGDFSPASGQITFGAGDRLEFLTFTIVNDNDPEGSETIGATLSGSAVTDPSTATFTILDEDSDDAAPSSRFHHPKQGLKYKQGDLRLREMHTVSGDVGVSGIEVVQLALRQRRRNGNCQWWNGSRFVAGFCRTHRWVTMRFLAEWSDTRDLYGRRFPALTPSIGTKVLNYTAWTRATDGSGNVEDGFERGRNLSTFEVRRR